MPVSVKRSPFTKPPTEPVGDLGLLTPQARVLAALMPNDQTDPVFDWPTLTRTQMCVRTGSSLRSMSPTRALNGVRAGSKSGGAHLGLLARGMVEEVVLTIEGISESNYHITALGIRALKLYLDAHNGKLPPIPNSDMCVNKRYRRNEHH